MNQYADVILPVPLDGYFTYAVPQEAQGRVATGIRVIVPFGRSKNYVGVIARLHDENLDLVSSHAAHGIHYRTVHGITHCHDGYHCSYTDYDSQHGQKCSDFVSHETCDAEFNVFNQHI